MRKWIFAVLCLLCGLLVTGVNAQNIYVTDQAGILSDWEIAALAEKAQEISADYACGVHIAVVEDYWDYGYSMEDSAWALYQQLGMGWGSDADGVFLLLSMEDRDYYIQANGGYGTKAFTVSGVEALADSFLDEFSEDDWYGGMEDYLYRCREYLQMAQEGTPYDPAEAVQPGEIAAIVLIPLLIALVVCLILKSQMKSVRPQSLAHEYMQLDESRLRIREDRYTHSTRVVRKIQKSTSSGGGSRHGSGGKF